MVALEQGGHGNHVTECQAKQGLRLLLDLWMTQQTPQSMSHWYEVSNFQLHLAGVKELYLWFLQLQYQVCNSAC